MRLTHYAGVAALGTLLAVGLAATAVLSARQAGPARAQGAGPATPQKAFVPVTHAMLWKPNPANGLMWRRTRDSHGFSPLTQIDRSNVSRLKMMWSRGMGAGNMEATPLVYDGVMYTP